MIGEVIYKNYNNKYGLILLNRPAKRNAISKDMVFQFKKSLANAKEEEIKCLVITGAGERMFCAGGDLTYLHGELTPHEALQELSLMKEVLYEIVSFPVPVICLLNGDALGGGCEIATACDVRIAKGGTKFGFIQTNIGITPAWGGGALLYEKVHPSFAFQWITEGEVFPAKYLHQKGWIHRIVNKEEWDDLDKLLRPYISKSSYLLKTVKKQYQKKIASFALSAEMDREISNCAKLWESIEHINAVNRFLTRKQANKTK